MSVAQSQSPHPASCAEPGVAWHQAEDTAESIDGDGAGLAKRALDVLAVDQAVDERDHSAETSGQSLGCQMIAEKFEQLLRAQRRELVDADLVGPHDPALHESLQQPYRAKLLVANHMRDNVFDAPAGTQAGCVPTTAASGSPGTPPSPPALRGPCSSGWLSFAGPNGEQASVAVQIQRPARLAVDTVGDRPPARTVAFQIAVFEVDACALVGLRGKAHLDFAGLGRICFQLPGRTDIPR